MYKGTLSSFTNNPFKYNIEIKELPFGFMNKIKNEAYVVFDTGVRQTTIEIKTEQEIIYVKSQAAILLLEIDKLKIKINLKDIVIKKNENNYELIFASISF